MAERSKRRGIVAGAAAGTLALAVLGTAMGAGADASPSIGVVLNGQPITFTSAPVMINNHVYVPVRDLAQALGIPVVWDASTDSVILGTAGSAAASSSASAVGGGSFTYEGLQYSATGLVAREYPGQQASSGVYWIVSYSITNTGIVPVDVPQAQPALVLFGPGGAQLAPDTALSGVAPGTVNPGISFTSYDVFDVPSSAVPAAYGLGFDTYQVVSGQFTTTAVSASLPAASSSTLRTTVGSSYAIQDVWNTAIQKLGIDQVVQTTAIVPDLTPQSFNPTTSFWIVDFDVNNPGPGDIAFNAGDFALNFGGSLSLAPSSVASLPGYVPATSLAQGVTVTAGNDFSGALLFAVPAGTPISNPALALSINGQTRIVSVDPCNAGVCPPIQG